MRLTGLSHLSTEVSREGRRRARAVRKMELTARDRAAWPSLGLLRTGILERSRPAEAHTRGPEG